MLVTLPLDRMTPEEKLRTMEALWESLAHDPGVFESPDWHEATLRERQRRVDAGETIFLAWDEAQNEIDRLVADGDAADAAR